MRYIKRRFSEGDSFLKDSKIEDYFIKVKEHNNQLPDNLYLLSGDNELEYVQIINYLSTFLLKMLRNLLNDLIQASFDCNFFSLYRIGYYCL